MQNVLNVMGRTRSLLTLIFFFSGFAALMYQVAWQRLLTVYYGVGSISITLIVSVYMFGMGLGALLGGRMAERSKNKILLYFVIELLIGCFGAVSVMLLDMLGANTAGSSYVTSLQYMFLFLSVPTLLMGMTLPLLTKIFNGIVRNFLDTVSFLYFINTIGAAIGAIFAAYVVISFFGLDIAVYAAAAINFVLAGLIFTVKKLPSADTEINLQPDVPGNSESIFGSVAYMLVFVTGFLAIGYEIAWFRVVGILVKASPYAFSSVLFVYLLGIALGSYGMNRYMQRYTVNNRKSLFFFLQFMIALTVIVIFTGYFYLTKFTLFGAATRHSFGVVLHPDFNLSVSSVGEFARRLYSIFDVFIWPAFFVFLPTLCMGASFPLVSALALTNRDSEGKTVGTVYFFNIMGNVLGGVVTGFYLLPRIGTEMTLLVFSIVGILFGLFITHAGDRRLSISIRVVVVTALAVFSFLIFPGAGQLYEVMHRSPGDVVQEVYFEEGIEGTVVTYVNGEVVWNFINGLAHGARPAYSYYYESVEAVSFARKMESVLIVGYGTGSIVEAMLMMDSVQSITLVEINSVLIDNLKKIPLFRDMLNDGRVKLVIDDGRRFLLNTNEKFDLITIDPLRSTTAYSNNIYSKQFFQLVNQSLNPGGIFMVWMDEFRVLPKTLISAFDYVRMYRFFGLGSNMSLKENPAHREQIMNAFSPEGRKKIETIGSKERENLDDLSQIIALVEPYPINEDWKPVLEYYIGLRFKESFLQLE